MTTATDRLLTRTQAAEVLNIKPQTLSVWLTTKRVPIPVVHVGRSVRYKLSDLLAYIESRTTTPTVSA